MSQLFFFYFLILYLLCPSTALEILDLYQIDFISPKVHHAKVHLMSLQNLP